MTSVRTKPLAPTNVGMHPRGLSLKYSGSSTGGLVSTSSMSRLLALAITKRTVVRALPYISRSAMNQPMKYRHRRKGGPWKPWPCESLFLVMGKYWHIARSTGAGWKFRGQELTYLEAVEFAKRHLGRARYLSTIVCPLRYEFVRCDAYGGYK